MTTLSLGQAARLTGRGKTILARAISGGLFAGSKEDGASKIEGAESARVYPIPRSCGNAGRVASSSRSRR
jgi:hypothetical protein